LNGGDEGLKKFFRRVHDVLEPGGAFVLEPQAWDTYAKAKRMDEVCLYGWHPFVPVFDLSGVIEIERKREKLTHTPRGF
jgi:hypothetical protein